MAAPRRHLVLFVRLPRYGVGKRRLAHDVGDAAAVRFERTMLDVLLRRLGRDRRWRLRLAVTPDRAQRHRWPKRWRAGGQGRGDLGARMRRALAMCSPGPVVLIGADIPAVRPDHIAAAFRLLGRCDLVFGPAEDGGFWLVGTRRWPLPTPLFESVGWSRPDTLAAVLRQLPPHVSVGLAARLADVDDGPSYRRLMPRRGF
ncbi:MAG: TIGR04282 family arsenosugar biosynthesis glycosyltransferase [Thiohalocapsa sp.]